MAAFMVSPFGVFVMGLFAGLFTTPSEQTLTVLAYGWAVASGERQTRRGGRKSGQRQPLPPVEAFFTTDLTLSPTAILAQYRERWAVEITLRDSNVFAGFGHDQCRKRARVVGANTLRLVLAAARTLWFVEYAARTPAIELRGYRPWYRQKVAPSQLDIVWIWREALYAAGVFPIPRFARDLAEIQPESENALPLAA